MHPQTTCAQIVIEHSAELGVGGINNRERNSINDKTMLSISEISFCVPNTQQFGLAHLNATGPVKTDQKTDQRGDYGARIST